MCGVVCAPRSLGLRPPPSRLPPSAPPANLGSVLALPPPPQPPLAPSSSRLGVAQPGGQRASRACLGCLESYPEAAVAGRTGDGGGEVGAAAETMEVESVEAAEMWATAATRQHPARRIDIIRV